MNENLTVMKMNSIARRYETSKNLIKNCRKALEGQTDIISCEESGKGYRDVLCIDLDNNEQFHIKLIEKDGVVYFDTFDDNIFEDYIELLLESKKNSPSNEYERGFNEALDLASKLYVNWKLNHADNDDEEDD